MIQKYLKLVLTFIKIEEGHFEIAFHDRGPDYDVKIKSRLSFTIFRKYYNFLLTKNVVVGDIAFIGDPGKSVVKLDDWDFGSTNSIHAGKFFTLIENSGQGLYH